MITVIYAGLIALLLVFLSLNVIRVRQSDGVSLGDGGNTLLQRRVRAQANLAEYAPVALILMFLLESTGSAAWFIHALGILFLVARIFHAIALSSETPRPFFRTAGAALTFVMLTIAGIRGVLAGFAV